MYFVFNFRTSHAVRKYFNIKTFAIYSIYRSLVCIAIHVNFGALYMVFSWMVILFKAPTSVVTIHGCLDFEGGSDIVCIMDMHRHTYIHTVNSGY